MKKASDFDQADYLKMIRKSIVDITPAIAKLESEIKRIRMLQEVGGDAE